jgi:hypothetical protein
MPDQTSITAANEAARAAALERLTANEQMELDRYVRANRPSLSLDTSKRLYELFLHGLSMEEICSLNPTLPTGAVIKARVDGRWDERREVYLGELLGETSTRLKQTGAEAVQFMSLLLAAAHKEHGEKLKKYLQTGNPDDLGGLRITSFKGYKDVIDSLAKLIGGQKGASAVTVNVGADGSGSVSDSSGSVTRWSPEEADAIRAAIEKKRQA